MQTLSANENIIPKQPKRSMSMDAHVFGMWLFIVSVVMIFAGFTSAMIVKKAQDPASWRAFDIPFWFYISTIVMLISSGSLYLAKKSAKKDDKAKINLFTLLTLVFGIVFLILQIVGFKALLNSGVKFQDMNTTSGSFFYVVAGTHWAHIALALLLLLFLVRKVVKGQVHANQLKWINMVSVFWHFLDFLWLYLLIFLVIIVS